jgi:hypothetical protein
MELERNQQQKMNNGKKRIAKWLDEQDLALGELYDGAIRMIQDRNFPGRLRFICHAVREIRNRLPEAIAGKSTLGRLDYSQKVEELAKACERAGLGSVRVVEEDEQRAEQTIPKELVVLISDLIAEHKAVQNRKLENTKRLIIALEPENKNLQTSLVPIIKRWIEETDWFVERAHIGRDILEDDLVTHFEGFESGLLSLVGYFYQGLEEIEQIVEKINKSIECPSKQDVSAVIPRLVRVRYRTYFFDKIENPHWIEPLKEADFFKSPAEPTEGEVYERWPEGWYLKKMSAKVPEVVLGVIKGIVSRNPFVRKACLECLLAMSEDVAAKGVTIVENLLQRQVEEGDWGWFWGGNEAAELMEKLARSHTEEAFKISWVLVDAWETGKEHALRDMTTKFGEYHYEELIFKYYNKLFEIDAERATGILVKILERYVKTSSDNKGYDVSSIFHIGLENLEQIDRTYAGVLAILVKGICEGGRAVIERHPNKVKGLLDYLEGQKKTIFYRIEMYLLRFVPKGVEIERIGKIISDRGYLEEQGYEYEYKLLLRDKFDEVPEARKVFEKWVDEQKIDDVNDWKEWFKRVRDREPVKEDIDKYEAGMKAGALFLVKERYPELYEKYKTKSGIIDVELAPRRMVGEAEWINPMEGSPLSVEEMVKMEPIQVIQYLCEPSMWVIDKENQSFFQSPEEGLAGTFKEVVKQRASDYAELSANELMKLKPRFLSKYFYGLLETTREKKFVESSRVKVLGQAKDIITSKGSSEEYKECFKAMLDIVQGTLDNDESKEKIVKSNKQLVWEIVEPLVKYEYNPNIIIGEDTDPHTECINSVQGKAFELAIRFGIIFKNEDGAAYEGEWSKKIVEILKYVLEEVMLEKVVCVFGIWMPQLYWLEENWVKTNLDKIFDDKKWDAVWGSYMSWGRLYKKVFELLTEHGKYKKAVEKIGSTTKYKYSKDPEESLAEHLMIAFFNGWIEIEDEVLKRFFEKASAELRGTAARFLTTGFKSVNEKGGKEKEEVAARMRKYWDKRLAAIKDKPKENEKEAIELTGWVEVSVLQAKETLELLEKSLELSSGKIGNIRDARDFVNGVCELGKGNELLALRCLKKAAADENMHMPWADIQDHLIKFLEDLPEDLRSVGREVADLYGRYDPDKFRGVWEKLNVTEENES